MTSPSRKAAIKARCKANNPERWKANQKRHNDKWRAQNLDYQRRWRKRKLEEKAGRPRPKRCEICGNKPDGKYKVLNFDHDHATGEFRGWICNRCNRVLGWVYESAELLHKLAKYLT